VERQRAVEDLGSNAPRVLVEVPRYISPKMPAVTAKPRTYSGQSVPGPILPPPHQLTGDGVRYWPGASNVSRALEVKCIYAACKAASASRSPVTTCSDCKNDGAQLLVVLEQKASIC